MPSFVQNVLLVLLLVLFSVRGATFASLCEENYVQRRLRRSVSVKGLRSIESKGSTLFSSLSPSPLSVSSITSSSPRSRSNSDKSEASSPFSFKNHNLPEKLVLFLESHPFPFAVDRFKPFDPLDKEMWINYFVSTKITMMETFGMVEALARELEAENAENSFWFLTGKTLKSKVVEVVFGSALAVYFKGPPNDTILQTFRDLRLPLCHQMIANKLKN